MNEQELIKNFQYNGFDISNYNNQIEVVNTDSSSMIDNQKQAIATTNTFSCTNILAFNKKFAYLVHMMPNETIGMNDKFLKRIEELKQIVIDKKINELNIIISLGESITKNPEKDFHNLDFINNELNNFVVFCNENNINLYQYPTLKSKFLLFDLKNQLLIVNNQYKKVINIDKLNKLKKPLTVSTNVKIR